MNRPDQRLANELRPISFESHIAPYANGSVLTRFGDTQVICGVTIEEKIPRWMKQQNIKEGWLSAEYTMLPYSTLERKKRNQIKPDSRSLEIQRLIGRSLRAGIDFKKLGERTIWVDCDVLQADGGTRTAAITGSYVALALAMENLKKERKIESNPIKKQIAAISAGIYQGKPILDLNYKEDKNAEVDINLVMTSDLEFVEIQGTGEEDTFTKEEFESLLELGREGILSLCKAQKTAIAQAIQ